MPKLNQIIAIEKGVKAQSLRELTDAHHLLKKPVLLSGIARTYRPVDDDGEQFPPESTRVQVKVENVIDTTISILTKAFNITATKDWANCNAVAHVIVAGETILENVPVTYLLFLEKQLGDLHTFIKTLPTLDASEIWEFDVSQNVWATAPIETTKTKKLLRNHVKAEATEQHPAQVDVYSEDVIIGYWRTVKYSGALPAVSVSELLDKVRKLHEAVKFAREEANGSSVEKQKVGEQFFAYLFGD